MGGKVMALVTDPSFIKSEEEYSSNINDDSICSFGSTRPASYVSLPVSPSLWAALNERKATRLVSSSTDADEQYYLLSSSSLPKDLKEWQYVGAHVSDSGLSCIIRQDPFSEEALLEEGVPSPADLEIDWLSLVATSLDANLDSQEMNMDLEEFPLLKACVSIPDEGEVMAIFGYPPLTEVEAYEGIVLRAWNKAFEDTSYSAVDSNYK